MELDFLIVIYTFIEIVKHLLLINEFVENVHKVSLKKRLVCLSVCLDNVQFPEKKNGVWFEGFWVGPSAPWIKAALCVDTAMHPLTTSMNRLVRLKETILLPKKEWFYLRLVGVYAKR